VAFTGRNGALPSVYPVSELATAAVALATSAIAEVGAIRAGQDAPLVHVDRVHASVAFRSERYAEPIGWQLPPVWDPIAGDYRARDRWIRLHTNYASHRDAVLRVLGVEATRDAVALATAKWDAEALETAVVDAGGAAACMRSADEWMAHPQGKAVAAEPLFMRETRAGTTPNLAKPHRAPLEGVRVLDLTRVIAGPVGTRVLAAYGASVLRIDPPAFEEVGAILPESTPGKRRAFLDLRRPEGRAQLETLLRDAHIIVHGYRRDALDKLGLGEARLREINPSVIDIAHVAYGWSGPWSNRRGFDSLVQMSSGIADRGRKAKQCEEPTPLPAQALDHACGYLIAAAAARGVARLLAEGQASAFRLSLARVAKLLCDRVDGAPADASALEESEIDACRETAETAFGTMRRVRCPGSLEGCAPQWTLPAGPLGTDAPSWA